MNKKILYVAREFPSYARKSLLLNLPENLRIINKSKNSPIKLHEKNLSKIKFSEILKIIVMKFFDFFNLPLIKILIPNKNQYFDYYLEDFVLPLTNKKVIFYQIENVGDFVEFDFKKLNSRLCLYFIKTFLLSKRCKYIFCMTEAGKTTCLRMLNIPKRKHYKFQVIYPTMEPVKSREKKDKGEIQLLFIANINKLDLDYNFYMKGGKLALQAYQRLKSKYKNLVMVYKGYIPPKYKKEFDNLTDVKYFSHLSYDELFKLYESSDIFIFPTYGDTLGFTFIEAMAHGLPIITIDNNFANNELIINEKTGFTVKTSLKFLKYPHMKIYPDWIAKKLWYKNLQKEDDVVGLKNLVEKLEILIKSKELREKFGENGRRRLVDGDLSIARRNKILNNLFKN
ncbi:MAG: glycosyltransferase family 4 protein [Candidatus Hermodarchaeota archaeon]